MSINVTKNVPMTVYVNEYSFTPEPVVINYADFVLIKQTYFTGETRNNGKIEAIKKLRELYKMGLSDAKYLVELMITTEGWGNQVPHTLGDILNEALKKQAT